MPSYPTLFHSGQMLARSKYQSLSELGASSQFDSDIICLRPTVEARNALATTAQRLAEDSRVQLRKIQGLSTKKGKYAKHSVELEEVCSFFPPSASHFDIIPCEQFQKLTDRHIAEVDKILAQMKKTMGTR